MVKGSLNTHGDFEKDSQLFFYQMEAIILIYYKVHTFFWKVVPYRVKPPVMDILLIRRIYYSFASAGLQLDL